MILLAGSFPVIDFDIGLIAWTTVIFLTVLFVLARYGFKPMVKALISRQHSIDAAMKMAEEARQEMAQLKARNEDLLAEAREERSKMLREAKEIRDEIIAEARQKAQEEYTHKVEEALEND